MFSVAVSASSGGAFLTTADRAEQYGAVVQKLGQIAQQMKAEPKALAAMKLQSALDQMRVLKLMGGGLGPRKQAEEAAQIAKQIGSASSEYADGIAASGSAPVAPQATSLAQASAAATSATPTDIERIADDPQQFFALAFGALKTLDKIMKQATQSLESDGDPRDAKEARRLKRDFGDAVSATRSATLATGVALTGDDAATGTGTDQDTELGALTGSLTQTTTSLDIVGAQASVDVTA